MHSSQIHHPLKTGSVNKERGLGTPLFLSPFFSLLTNSIYNIYYIFQKGIRGGSFLHRNIYSYVFSYLYSCFSKIYIIYFWGVYKWEA